jgi:hypothetical protein
MSLSKFEALTKVKPEILQSLYATADDDKKRSFTAVLELVEQLQNSEADVKDASTSKKKKTMIDLKVSDVSKSIVAAIVQHCNGVGAGPCCFLFVLCSFGMQERFFRSSKLGR